CANVCVLQGKPLSGVKTESSASASHLLDLLDFSLLFHKKSEHPVKAVAEYNGDTAFQHQSAEFKLSSALHKLINYKAKPAFFDNASKCAEYCCLWKEFAIRLAGTDAQSSYRCIGRMGILVSLNDALEWSLSIVKRSSSLGQGR